MELVKTQVLSRSLQAKPFYAFVANMKHFRTSSIAHGRFVFTSRLRGIIRPPVPHPRILRRHPLLKSQDLTIDQDRALQHWKLLTVFNWRPGPHSCQNSSEKEGGELSSIFSEIMLAQVFEVTRLIFTSTNAQKGIECFMQGFINRFGFAQPSFYIKYG